MGYDLTIDCPTQRCIDYAAKYGQKSRVSDTKHNKWHTCERCGGELIDGQWQHKCKSCGKDVAPGELGGLFVPHLCQPCLKRRRETDAKCSRCNKPNIDCCC